MSCTSLSRRKADFVSFATAFSFNLCSLLYPEPARASKRILRPRTGSNFERALVRPIREDLKWCHEKEFQKLKSFSTTVIDMSETREVVVTGLGVISPIGLDVETFWQALLDGKSGVAKITRFDASGLPSQIGAENSSIPCDLWTPRTVTRKIRKVEFKRQLVKEQEKITG